MKLDILELRKEMQRRKTKRISLLGYLQKHGSITTTELWKFGGTGASSRLHELRESHKISPAIYIQPGLYKYVYRGAKAKRQQKQLVKKAERFEDKIMSFETTK